jgi:hypothetical protein
VSFLVSYARCTCKENVQNGKELKLQKHSGKRGEAAQEGPLALQGRKKYPILGYVPSNPLRVCEPERCPGIVLCTLYFVDSD